MGTIPLSETMGIEPIAIVGIGCRMPGEVRSAFDMWKLLMSKGIGRSDKVPKSRYNIDAYLHPDNERPGSFNVPGGFFLEDDLDAFDASIFNISPVEALWMDPQQRKLLEVVYEAFENSGTTLQEVANQTVGCFIGCFSLDYQFMTMKESDFRHSYAAMGVDTGILSNRISHVFDLKGPSAMVNTACSSSLYALDLACNAIHSGECDGAIVGGANLMLTVDQQMNTAKMGVLSAHSQSRPFDDSADGYGRAEGIGAIFIKSLSAALRDGDPIRSIIRSTATSHNGYNADGISRPSIKGQTNAISLAYKLGGLRKDKTEYIECHGTGTQVGDPIEIKAIHEAMGIERPTGDPILVGSVKANLGHGEAVSSIATLIKATMALENGVIPPTALFEKGNSAIPWDQVNVKVVTEPVPLAPAARIGVNAFGYGGTNAHVILEHVRNLMPSYSGHKSMIQVKETTTMELSHQDEDEKQYLLLFSAHNKQTLENYIADVSSSCKEASLSDLAFTLGIRRTKLQQRAFSIAKKNSFASDTKAAAQNITSNMPGECLPAFVFTGQGAQWQHMGSTLIKTYPSVLHNIRRLDRYLSNLKAAPSWTIETLLLDPDQAALVDVPEYSQPLCTALQIVIVDLMATWSLRPVATIGHSSGEIAAAYAAGIISAENAITAAYLRGKVAASLNTDGAMLALAQSAEEAISFINDYSAEEKVVVACHNSPSSVTLSGDRDAILGLKDAADKKKIFARVLETGGKAYHSHHMKDAALRYMTYLQNESLTSEPFLAQIPMFSTVETSLIQHAPDAYWVSNLNRPVLFNQGVQYMLREMPEVSLIIEVGPHPALSGPLRQICREVGKPNVGILSTLKRRSNDIDQMLQLAGNLWTQDAKFNIETVLGTERLHKDGVVRIHKGSLLVDLPKYHWTYGKPNLAETRASKDHRGMKEPRHDILGRCVIGGSPLEPVWRNILRQRDLPWLAQHKLAGEVMLPAAAYLALAIEAIEQVNMHSQEPLEIHSYTMRDVVISTATVVPDDDDGTETLFRLSPAEGKLEISQDGETSQWYEFSATCCSYGVWKEAAKGLVCLNAKGRAADHKPHLLPETPIKGNHLDWLDRERELGIDLGPAFHHVSNVYTDGQSHIVRGDMKISRECGIMDAESHYVLHPTVIDSCLQPFVEMLHKGHLEKMTCGIIPTHFGEVTIFRPSNSHLANECSVQLWADELGQRSYSSNVQLIGYDGSLLVDMSDSRCLLYRAALPQSMQGDLQRDLYLQQTWNLDADYMKWAKEKNHFSGRSIREFVEVLAHKDINTQVLITEHNLIPYVTDELPDVRMTVSVISEEHELVSSAYANNDRMKIVDHEFLLSDIRESRERYSLVITSGLQNLQQQHKFLSTGGNLILRMEDCSMEDCDAALKDAGFSPIQQILRDNSILTESLVTEPAANGPHTEDKDIILVYRNSPGSLHALVSTMLEADGWKVFSRPISTITECSDTPVILLVDTEGPLLVHLEETELKALVALVENCSAMIWVTCGGLLTGDKPEYGMTAGAARTICKENASLDLVTVDFNTTNTTENRVASLIIDVVSRQHDQGRNGETEYYMQDDLVYIGRLMPNKPLNAAFVLDSGETTRVQQHDSLILRAETNNGIIVYRKMNENMPEELRAEEVEIKVAALGLSASDGADDSAFLSHELAGTVTRIGSAVESIMPGMSVVGFAIENLSTVQLTSCHLVQPLPDGCSLINAASLPSAFTTAIYGLEELARIMPGENVVIFDALGAVGQAAIQVCQLIGAKAIVVTSSPATTEAFFRDNEAPCDSVIVLKWDTMLSQCLKRATAKRGVDVLLYPATADRRAIVECGRAMATFGRIVCVGHASDYRSVSDDLSLGSAGLSFFQFDLIKLIKHRPQVVGGILQRCFSNYREGRLRALNNIQIKVPTDVNHAISTVPNEMQSGKFIVNYDNNAIFEVSPSPRPLVFRSDATYLLVGCLGGLGRQVALWMARRGAKHLAFVSRSGAGNKAAAKTIQLLQEGGVHATVLRANITHRDELQHALSTIDTRTPIRGVVNAASVFRDASFSKTTVESWRQVVETKVQGSMFLHDLLKQQPLDFFVMTSSVASMLGSNGQTAYSAANSFLDSLARHRRSLGLPAVSLILPAIFGIGHIADNQEIEKAIQIKGMYGIYEKEMLDAFEIAMSPQGLLPIGTDHIIVGLQPRRFGPAVKAAGAHSLSEDNRRLSWIAASAAQQAGGGGNPNSRTGSSEDIFALIRQGGQQEEVVSLLITLISRRLRRLLMIDEELIFTTQRSVASHGLDSMIGAEFRNWIFREFKMNIPFQQLLAGSLTITQLAQTICGQISEASIEYREVYHYT